MWVTSAAAQQTRPSVTLIYAWNPRVGLGAAYQMINHFIITEIDLTTVGRETVDGRNGYWIETNTLDAQMISKELIVPVVELSGQAGRTHVRTARAVSQHGGDPPEELPGQPAVPNLWDLAHRVGIEDVDTPAGTFHCEHFRSNDGKWEGWFSREITPFGLVKLINESGTEMVFTGTIRNATDHITETPRQPVASAPGN
jgi:hypothetical protein